MKNSILTGLFLITLALAGNTAAQEAALPETALQETALLETDKTSAQTLNMTGGHRGGITSIIHNGNTVLSAGEDGFLITWDVSKKIAVDRLQLTTYRILSMVKHPQKDEVCVIESSVSGNYYRLSAWNYAAKQKLFSIISSKPVSYINYSAGGNLIIASDLDGYNLSIINSSTGEINKDPVISNGHTAAAVTGRTERNVMIYQSEYEELSGQSAFMGQILYLNLSNLSTVGNFQTAGYMTHPVTIMNDLFIAGVNGSGLHIVNAANGQTLDSNSVIGRNAILCPLEDGFYCYDRKGNQATLYRFTVARNNGRLNIASQIPLPTAETGNVTAIAYNRNLALSTSEGKLFLLEQNKVTLFASGFQKQITEIAVGEKTIAFFCDDGKLSILPLDYKLIDSSFSLKSGGYNNYEKITSFTAADKDYYIIWQTASTRNPPQLIAVNHAEIESESPQTRNLSFIIARSPLRSISVYNNKFLTLDTAGNISIRALDTIIGSSNSTKTDFTFSSPGAINASFINNDYIIVSSSVVNNSSPFLSVNTRTGETVPYSFKVHAGLMIYPGKSGSIYAAAIEQKNTLNTIFFNITSSNQENRIMEYHGEAHHYTITESQDRLIIACDSEGIAAFKNSAAGDREKSNFERTSGLPVSLYSYEDKLICLDSEGNIAWYGLNGRILAVFSITGNRWALDIRQSGQQSSGRKIYGNAAD